MEGPRKWTVQSTKVDGPQRMKLDGTQKCVGGQKGVKVDGPHKMKLDGTKKCVGGQKRVKVDGPHKMKVHGPKMRGWSKKGESGRSQNA